MTNIEWKVAPSYQNWKIEAVDEKAKKIRVTETCWKCGGSGVYAWFGTCFACNGAGKFTKWVKAYTPEEYDRYIQAQERAKEKKAEKLELERQEKLNKSEENQKELLTKWGYDTENPLIWLVGGGNTYEIKDQLKESGCKFNPKFGWYCSHEFDVPVGYDLVSINFFDVYTWFPLAKRFELNDNAKEIADAAKKALEPESHSEYIGEIKERLRDLQVKLISEREIDSYYGTSILYTFAQDENILVWFCSGKPIDKEINIGDEILLTGTVKAHDEYNGIKQTKLNRCIIKRA